MIVRSMKILLGYSLIQILHQILFQDMLKHCSLPLSLCRGQAYDGAANIQGKRNGVATKIQKDILAAIAIHCFAHSLNFCLQDAGRKLVFLHNALDTVKEIAKLIKFST